VYRDLQVTGIDPPPVPMLNPFNCVLTSTAGGYDASNSTVDPLFVLGYSNTLFSAAILDEGGNAISVRFFPVTESAGNYHILTGSGAENLGGVNHPSALYPETDNDYDGAARPALPNVDSGADQI
jgi:hypothetical protein